MLDLDVYKQSLALRPELAQVVFPGPVSVSDVDAASLIVSLIEPHVGDRVYPLNIPQDSDYPAVSYHPEFSVTDKVDGYDITRTEGFVLNVIAVSFADIVTAIDNIRAALIGYSVAGNAGGIVVVDQAVEYVDSVKRYRGLLEIEVTHLAQPSQVLPAAFIYPLKDIFAPNRLMGSVSQSLDGQFGVVIIGRMPAKGVSGLASLRNVVSEAVVNVRAGGGPAEHREGEVISVAGGLVIWRDQFAAEQLLSRC